MVPLHHAFRPVSFSPTRDAEDGAWLIVILAETASLGNFRKSFSQVDVGCLRRLGGSVDHRTCKDCSLELIGMP